MTKIAVVGTGYAGLVKGNKVTCVDIDKAKVEKLSAGQSANSYPRIDVNH